MRRCGLSIGVLAVTGGILSPAVASAGTLGSARVLATPTFTSPVAAAGGVIAWAASSGRGHRFEVLISRAGKTHALASTSAVGWIEGVKLGTDAHGHAIVVYSRCPHAPFGSATPGQAGTDGCLLWWAALSGGRARRIVAAPADTTVGTATAGRVVFAIQPITSRPNQPARLETTTLTGHTARSLPLSKPDGAIVTDISAAGSDVAFIEEPHSTEDRTSPSQVWLDAPGAAPRLLDQQIGDAVPVDHEEHFFDGVTLTGNAVYAFLYASPALSEPPHAPPTHSELVQIPLAGGTAATARWTSTPFSSFGIQAAAFDPSDDQLVLDLFSSRLELASEACSSHASSARACPILTTGPVEYP
jgi:hypothetical protein